MIEIGKYNTLRVVKVVDFGVYLDGEERGEILLPNEYVPKDCFPEDYLKVFVYFDSEDRIIATTEVPNIRVGEFAWMKVVSTSSVGLFGLGVKKRFAGAFPGTAGQNGRGEILSGICLCG